ncbi:hypothetical protein Ade02nite_46800 [Paractinoplanes deccanensis]|uniref:Uncharacterized protein n=1 Tax=Paractinoplanes deccanensis TaxID=113561 RepID=A0ABQ3Y7R4_9ACTN|nr:hypothetical protein Ade02nite_46800 [Actinoplanes deccanensis]
MRFSRRHGGPALAPVIQGGSRLLLCLTPRTYDNGGPRGIGARTVRALLRRE